MILSRLAATLTAGAVLAASTPAVFALPAHREAARQFVSPAARGVAADIGRTRGVRDLGRLGSKEIVRVGLLMHFRNEPELQMLTRLQSRRGSPYYRKFLSTAQWNAYFAPDAATYAKTERTMQRAGFRLTRAYPNRGFLVMQAPGATVERYFNTELHRVYQTGRGIRYANVRPATMPRELRDTVISVAGLHTTQSFFVAPHPHRNAASDARARSSLTAMLMKIGSGARVRTAASPAPVVVATPPVNPSPDPTESPNNVVIDLTNSLYGVGPPDFAIGYDYPVQHGYGGTGHATGSVIDSDNSDHDMALEFGAFDIPNHGYETRVCTDPADATSCELCDATASKAGTATKCDAEGESTLDAEALRTMAPDAQFVEYLVNQTTSLIDLNIEAAYERVVSDDVVDAVNSSFGGCETDDPSELYAVNYIAMEGAAKGITFAASAGDTGALNCGVYVTNGAPQTEVNVASPCAAYYFTCVGGTSYDIPVTGATTNYYVAEQAWLDGGGGYSVLEPLPDWQAASVAAALPTSVSTLGRNTPDVSMTADAGAAFIGGTQGVGLIIFNAGTEEGSGGTSLASPMFVASLVSGNHARGSRGGWINPRLYEIQQNAAGYAAAFNDITTSANFIYAAAPGYDDATGIGSAKGWELAGEE